MRKLETQQINSKMFPENITETPTQNMSKALQCPLNY